MSVLINGGEFNQSPFLFSVQFPDIDLRKNLKLSVLERHADTLAMFISGHDGGLRYHPIYIIGNVVFVPSKTKSPMRAPEWVIVIDIERVRLVSKGDVADTEPMLFLCNCITKFFFKKDLHGNAEQ